MINLHSIENYFLIIAKISLRLFEKKKDIFNTRQKNLPYLKKNPIDSYRKIKSLLVRIILYSIDYL